MAVSERHIPWRQIGVRPRSLGYSILLLGRSRKSASSRFVPNGVLFETGSGPPPSELKMKQLDSSSSERSEHQPMIADTVKLNGVENKVSIHCVKHNRSVHPDPALAVGASGANVVPVPATPIAEFAKLREAPNDLKSAN